MNIDQFVSKYNIALDPEIYAACFDGIEVMGKSIDPHHNNSHVDNLLNYLDILLISNPAVGTTISSYQLSAGTMSGFHNDKPKVLWS